MSATWDAKLFQDYFNNCPLVHITGRNFQVTTLYIAPKQAGPSFIVDAARVALHIHQKEEPGHILVFLPGEEEIHQVCRLLRSAATDLDVFPLFSAMSSEDQGLALSSSSSANRKCIVATNVAETSLTIDNVVYVIDTGVSRQSIFNPRLRMNMLEVRPISQASARQRAGRAGRTKDGVCYRLYTEEDYDRMALTTEPAIRRESIDSAILKLASFGVKDFVAFDWLTAPHPESILRAAQDLKDWYVLHVGQPSSVPFFDTMRPF